MNNQKIKLKTHFREHQNSKIKYNAKIHELCTEDNIISLKAIKEYFHLKTFMN